MVENLIKAGALDNMGATRKQCMMAYAGIMDGIAQDKKNTMAGQMTLFDLAGEETKADFEVKLPDVGEYAKEMYLGFEKEVLGVYISGHPLEEYEEKWRKNITRVTTDFMLEEESGQTRVADGEIAMVGGMIVDKTVKYTKNNQTMAFITLEDLVGTLEIIIFPKSYEANNRMLNIDEKVFVRAIPCFFFFLSSAERSIRYSISSGVKSFNFKKFLPRKSILSSPSYKMQTDCQKTGQPVTVHNLSDLPITGSFRDTKAPWLPLQSSW